MPFRDVIGHRRLVGLLARSVERDTLPPSLILAGPDGIGKRLLAVATAQALNCLAPVRHEASDAGPLSPLPYDACGTCAACTRIARNVHPDVLLVEPGESGSIKIDRVREVVDSAAYRPFEGRRRAVIFDEADALVPPAQNALLKTLEEPPPASVFLLVTSRPDVLLPTVQSRCPRLRFRPLSTDDVTAVLVGKGRDATDARAAAVASDGSVARALEASGDEFMQAREIAARVLVQVAQSGDPRRRIEGARDLLAKSGGSGASDREQLAVFLRAMASLLRDVELVGSGADRRAQVSADLLPAIDRLAAYRGERGLNAFQAVDEALAALERNAGAKIVADWVTLHL